MYFTNCTTCGYEWPSDEKPKECLGCGSKHISTVTLKDGEL